MQVNRKRMEGHDFRKAPQKNSTKMTKFGNALLAGQNGTCTSHALFICNQSSDLDFVIGDTGGHTIAWTDQGVVVDNSARILIQLPNEMLLTWTDLRYFWEKPARKYHPVRQKRSKHERGCEGPHTKRRNEAIICAGHKDKLNGSPISVKGRWDQ